MNTTKDLTYVKFMKHLSGAPARLERIRLGLETGDIELLIKEMEYKLYHCANVSKRCENCNSWLLITDEILCAECGGKNVRGKNKAVAESHNVCFNQKK